MANPNPQPQGGPIIGAIQLVPIIWGSGWPYDAPSTLPPQLLAFLQFFAGPNNPQLQMLAEYDTGGTSIEPGAVVGNQIVVAPGNPPPQLTDRQIANSLFGWITNSNNQTPGFPQPGPNTVYVIFLPQAVSVTDPSGKVSCLPTNGFSGYHAWIGIAPLSEQPYVVMPCCVVPTTTPYGIVFNALSVVCSHELCEVITDPIGNGWVDTGTNPTSEIADFCFFQTNGNVQAGGGQTFQVQSVWSNSQQACVFGPPVRVARLTLPPMVLGGQSVNGTLTLNNAAPAFPVSPVSVALSADNPIFTFASPVIKIPPGQFSASFTANTAAVAAPTVVTVSAALGGGRPFTQLITVLPPAIQTFRYSPVEAVGYQYPPEAPVGVLTLNQPAPAGGLIVGITSSNKLLAAPTPDELSIAAGQTSPAAPFYLQVNPAGATTSVTLSADVAGTSTTFIFTVLAGGPSNIVVSSLTITPATVTGGATAFARFTLAAAVGPDGGNIIVESSDPVASAPATVPLAAGATGGSFQIYTTPLQRPVSRKYATIMAGKDGAPAHALLTVVS